MKPTSPPDRGVLKSAFLVDPPPELRDRILVRSRPPGSVRHAPIIAAAMAVALVMVLPAIAPEPAPEPATMAVDWRARSAELEREWRQIGDREWLLGDARAAPISQRLRRLDERLSAQVGDTLPSRHVSELWRERSETLAELVSLRRQGGYAIRL